MAIMTTKNRPANRNCRETLAFILGLAEGGGGNLPQRDGDPIADMQRDILRGILRDIHAAASKALMKGGGE